MKLYGPYRRSDGRWQITVCRDDKTITSISYPKYVYEEVTGYILKQTETIDHIDNNPDNNCFYNLQVLSRADNARKAIFASGRNAKVYYGVCAICGNAFTKLLRQVRGNIKRGCSGPFCSRKCAGLASSTRRKHAEICCNRAACDE